MKIFVGTLEHGIITVEVEPNEPIENVKAKIQDQGYVPPDEQRLVLPGKDGKQLEDGHTLSYYNIQMYTKILVIRRLRGD